MRVSNARWVWDDSGSGADKDGSFWKITIVTDGFYPVDIFPANILYK